MAPIIRVRGVAKSYRLGGPPQHANNLREVITNAVRAPVARLRALAARGEEESFWALNDISFDVAPGDPMFLAPADRVRVW